MARLTGHGLISEGAPHDDAGVYSGGGGIIRTSGPGRAKCECGALSEYLPSANARKQWHRDHKAQIAHNSKES